MRTSDSWNLTNLPSLVPIIISLLPFVFLTEINSSSSFKTIAFLPLFLILSNSNKEVLFINPFFVINAKYLVSSFSYFITIVDVIFSSFSIGNKLTIGKPLD